MEKLAYVINNFVWVPIVSAIIGVLFTIILTPLIKKIIKAIKKRRDNNADEIQIGGEWSSVFVEENVLVSESVKIEQTGRNISAIMRMGKREYEFQGEFKNQILTGQYISSNRKKDERGTVVLKYINENLMSGYCTFIYKNKQVYNSPYVLVSSNNHDVKKGTYKFCNSCIGTFNCCCNCDTIDMPILLPFEVDRLSRVTKNAKDAFAEKKTASLYQMKRKDNPEKSGGCYFFINGACSIYENRPIDCRLFPFDFKEIGGEYWVIYYNKVCKAIPTEKEDIELCSYSIRPLLSIVMPYMSECSNPVFSEKLNNQEFIKLFRIDHLLDDK